MSFCVSFFLFLFLLVLLSNSIFLFLSFSFTCSPSFSHFSFSVYFSLSLFLFLSLYLLDCVSSFSLSLLFIFLFLSLSLFLYFAFSFSLGKVLRLPRLLRTALPKRRACHATPTLRSLRVAIAAGLAPHPRRDSARQASRQRWLTSTQTRQNTQRVTLFSLRDFYSFATRSHMFSRARSVFILHRPSQPLKVICESYLIALAIL